MPQIFYEPSTFFTEMTASGQAKCVAERFISIFSMVGARPNWTTSHNIELLTSENRDTLKSILTGKAIKSLKEGDIPESSSFYIVGRGSNHYVWGHSSYPNIVIKLMNKECAHSQLHIAKRSLEVTQAMKNCWIQIPRVSFVDAGDMTAYIEEHLPIGLDESQHKELWARILIHYQSSECSALFKEHLQELIEQIQNLIMRIGFWDVGYRNLPEVRIDGAGVCATDFEQIDDKDDLKRVRGLEKLAHLFPFAPLVDPIITGNKQMPLVNFMNTLKFGNAFDPNQPGPIRISKEFHAKLENKKESLETLQKAIQIYDKKDYLTGDEEIVSCCDLASLDTDEKALAQQLLLDIRQAHNDRRGGTVSQRRCLDLQPRGNHFYKYSSYTRDRFLKVLNVLKGQNSIILWSDDYKLSMATKGIQGLQYVFYKIYF